MKNAILSASLTSLLWSTALIYGLYNGYMVKTHPVADTEPVIAALYPSNSKH